MIDGLKKVLVFEAHTDDSMVCAGTLHRLAKNGCQVHVVAFGTAATKEDKEGGDYSTAIVLPEWQEAMDRIGVKNRRFCDYQPSKNLHLMGEKIADVAFEYCEKWKPDAVFTLSPEDENPAHRVVGEQCERVTRGRVPIHIRYLMPWNYAIGRPNLYVKLEPDDLECKKFVIDCYKSQHHRYGYLEMLTAYDRANGLSVKTEYAERFELIRGVF